MVVGILGEIWAALASAQPLHAVPPERLRDPGGDPGRQTKALTYLAHHEQRPL
jgi:hypothetical protein